MSAPHFLFSHCSLYCRIESLRAALPAHIDLADDPADWRHASSLSSMVGWLDAQARHHEHPAFKFEKGCSGEGADSLAQREADRRSEEEIE